MESALYSKPNLFREEDPMCDYSLAHFRSRLAVEGEPLVVHRFPSGSRGLASLDPGLKELVFRCSTTAVCPSRSTAPVTRHPEIRATTAGSW